jgi:hypothetical protein
MDFYTSFFFTDKVLRDPFFFSKKIIDISVFSTRSVFF